MSAIAILTLLIASFVGIKHAHSVLLYDIPTKIIVTRLIGQHLRRKGTSEARDANNARIKTIRGDSLSVCTVYGETGDQSSNCNVESR